VSEHHIPQASFAAHVVRPDCPCGPASSLGRRPDGSFGLLVVHRDWTDLIDDRDEESNV
jgi:hypothetical protein